CLGVRLEGSFLFLEYGLESDAFEALERSRAAFDLHTKYCALPGSQQEFGEFHRIERRVDFTDALSLGNAGGKWSAPFLEYCLQPCAQTLALIAGLETEVADQAAAIPFVARQHIADDVQVPFQPLPGGKRPVVQRLFDKGFGAGKISVQHFLGKCLLGAEMIGEAALRNTGCRTNITHTRTVVP